MAVASPERLPEFPDLPTVAETIPGFSATGWQVLVAPIGTTRADYRQGERRPKQSGRQCGL